MNKGLIALPYRFPYLDFSCLPRSPHFPSGSDILMPGNKYFSHSSAPIIYTNRARQTALAALAGYLIPTDYFLTASNQVYKYLC
jgi:hypothetical protein